MKRVLLLALLIGFIATTTQSRAQEMKSYESDKFGFYITVPKTWTIVPDEDNDCFALYNPEALTNQTRTLDLTTGLKIEILPQTDEMLADFLDHNDLKQEVKGSNKYYFRDNFGFYLFTVIKSPAWNFLIIGYFPEKKKEAVYVPQYQKVVDTFTLI